MKKSNQSGFSMVEILFSIFVMAIALFGLSALQLTTLKSVTNSQVKTLAIFYLEDMAERMRSNPWGVFQGEYIQITGGEVLGGSIATSDAYLWNQLISDASSDGSLPDNAIGTVQFDAATQLYDINISWDEEQSQKAQVNGVSQNGAPITKSFTLSVSL